MTNKTTAAGMKAVPNNQIARDLTKADIEKMAKDACNWGKWGPDDEIGTLNYITPKQLIEAAKLVKKGKSISLGLDFNFHGVFVIV